MDLARARLASALQCRSPTKLVYVGHCDHPIRCIVITEVGDQRSERSDVSASCDVYFVISLRRDAPLSSSL